MYIYRVEDRIGNGYIGRDSVHRGGSGGDRVRAELNGNPVQSHGYRIASYAMILHHTFS